MKEQYYSLLLTLKNLGYSLLSMADSHLNTILTMQMFCKMLGRID